MARIDAFVLPSETRTAGDSGFGLGFIEGLLYGTAAGLTASDDDGVGGDVAPPAPAPLPLTALPLPIIGGAAEDVIGADGIEPVVNPAFDDIGGDEIGAADVPGAAATVPAIGGGLRLPFHGVDIRSN